MSNQMSKSNNGDGVMTNFPYNDPTFEDIIVNFLTCFVYNLIAMLLHHMSISDIFLKETRPSWQMAQRLQKTQSISNTKVKFYSLVIV